jgi:hypothetical protein
MANITSHFLLFPSAEHGLDAVLQAFLHTDGSQYASHLEWKCDLPDHQLRCCSAEDVTQMFAEPNGNGHHPAGPEPESGEPV